MYLLTTWHPNPNYARATLVAVCVFWYHYGMANCSFENCDKKSHAQVLCAKHYTRMYRYGDPSIVTPTGSGAPLEARMKARTAVTEAGCREWVGERRRGYGIVTHEKRRWYAHRLAWTLANGPIPNGLLVCHRCDNPPCINVEHMFLGTNADNMQDASTKGRLRGGAGRKRKSTCKNGHPFDRLNSKGQQVCSTCLNAYMRQYRARKARMT